MCITFGKQRILLALPAKKAFTYNTAVHFIFLFVKWQIEIESACKKCSAQKTHTDIVKGAVFSQLTPY